MAAFLVAGMGCTLAACDDDDAGTPPPTEPGVEAVIGTYSGTMSLEEAAPTAGNETSETTELEASVSDKEVLFADFPIRELVVRIAGEDGADAIHRHNTHHNIHQNGKILWRSSNVLS